MTLLPHQRDITRKLALCRVSFDQVWTSGSVWLHWCMCVCLNRKQMTGYSPHLMTGTVLCTNTWQRPRDPEMWTQGFRRLMSGIKALEKIFCFAAHAALWQRTERDEEASFTQEEEREGEEWVCVYLRCVWPQSCEWAHTQTVRADRTSFDHRLKVFSKQTIS